MRKDLCLLLILRQTRFLHKVGMTENCYLFHIFSSIDITMKNIFFWLIILLWSTTVFASEISFWRDYELNTPFLNTIDFSTLLNNSISLQTLEPSILPTTTTTYEQGTLLAEYVDPRSDGFSSFPWGSCTEYVARQRPELFINEDGTRRMTGNAEDWLRNAQRLWLEIGSIPQKWSIAVYYEGRWGRQYGHVAYVQEIQSNGMIIVSEMNYEQEYVVTYRVVPANLAAGYIY